MARVSKKDVYTRIDEKREEIKQTEEQLAKLNEELKVLYEIANQLPYFLEKRQFSIIL